MWPLAAPLADELTRASRSTDTSASPRLCARQAALEAAVTTSIVEEGQEAVHLQITLISSKQPISIRKLLSNQVSNLVTIPGIVISTSRVKAKARCTEHRAPCAPCTVHRASCIAYRTAHCCALDMNLLRRGEVAPSGSASPNSKLLYPLTPTPLHACMHAHASPSSP